MWPFQLFHDISFNPAITLRDRYLPLFHAKKIRLEQLGASPRPHSEFKAELGLECQQKFDLTLQ